MTAQKFTLQLVGKTSIENKVIDSINYNQKHNNIKSLTDEIELTSERLAKIGYIENKIFENKKLNDSSYITTLSIGKKINWAHLYIGINSEIKNTLSLDLKNDTIKIAFNETEKFLNLTMQKLENKGFALAKLKLINIQIHGQTLIADLYYNPNQKRQLNAIIVKFNDDNKKNSFPEGHLHQINRKFNNNIFNQDVVRKIHDEFEEFRFVSQIKYPEILLTKDTTKVYVYLEKRNSNTFDGYIGFTNNENNKLVINGYLDLNLENTLKVGEQFSLYWKSDGKNQKTFKTTLEIPYLFNIPIGIKAQLQIFKQDSIYQNTKTAIALGYLINYNTRIYLGYQSTESSDIQNTNNTTISDYKNSFITSNLEFSKYDTSNSIFSKKTNLSITIGYGKRTTPNLTENTRNNKQFYVNTNAMHNFYLNKKNCININYHNYYLKSDTYIINELYRFGGTNTIRGFAENSLQASFISSLATEYRYIISPELYIHTILDYGYYQDKTSENFGNLLGVGFGFGIQTKSGLLKLSFTNGATKNQNFKSTNTIVNINYNVKF
ncbi:hypothetical protein E0F76_12265 [Flavobacterium cellulosilyticum]|uniref:POTRA domain-containing protein n=2 Tax=Flavobacterium cellulosilyticum TaxID=2541731 RepID=A0A4V2YZB2_9FLAO|nr:hypothetical protein E0F76_12265 [Flavobacterium cellulosilyticum]